MRSNGGMNDSPNHAPDTGQRLTDLEIKASYADDLLDTLNQLVARQQQQIDLLLREVARLRQRGGDEGLSPAPRDPRDELPPHY
jgi:SlyX protein